jgi:hypothetical protein
MNLFKRTSAVDKLEEKKAIVELAIMRTRTRRQGKHIQQPTSHLRETAEDYHTRLRREINNR